MTTETFWASAFGAACGAAGVMALLGILSWTWRQVALWWIGRSIRRATFKEAFIGGPGTAQLSPFPPYPAPEQIMETVRAMGGPPLQGAAAGIQACYEGPARQVGTVVGAYPEVIGPTSLPSGEVVFLVRVTDALAYACPCCHKPTKPLADLVGTLEAPEPQEYIDKAFPPPLVTPCEGPPDPGGPPPPASAS
jgi:hypothetical protein